ncbi:carboxymuconolactone decarboxylase family protein [Eilatimonas milleporae]|uniref:Alkylhydroperoxidase family enzyme n=1 Tax=Eilatimonas milleporae TaxID=911205 RepID=A0A3M0CUE6_9PROT|nr:carboxymuconolactone decarboxylase family protein [Eilatimonas milleporae]RMB12110.1 alkylhydroperoxidase family enzyme [Eilatimonas milleporae]
MADTPLARMPRHAMDDGLGAVWDRLNGLTGEPAFVEAFAVAPELLSFVMDDFYGKIFFAGRLDNKYKQLARLYLSLTHGCMTCNKQNIPGSLEAGLSRQQIDALPDHIDDGPFDAAERAVLRYAAQMALTNHDGHMTAALHKDLRAHFDDAQICELGVVMAVIGGMAKLSFVLGLVEKEDYCPFA